ncbi:hypothetical protein [Vibrio mimicus]|uniref:Uncharacterized protein n=1 Tax=Vibrio mimicus TaxID=674 RepID=A0A2J9VJ99_VIBMI|nr:hypothetical protein [Vibrio mimicus]EEW10062.1 hypothetical protein VMD_24580 [Vibrio mimicus VM573]KFE29350.1 hypothetical protein DN31_3939 [Vibrio mimicus]PNM63865.1 hypothetical protein AL544_002645 [Vibrio mimicus]
MDINNRELSYLSLGVSFLAMLGTALGAYYSSEQSTTAKNSYIAALEQLNVQKNELLIAKDTYAASLEQLHLYKQEIALAKNAHESALEQIELYKEQLELQKELIDREQQYSVVISTETKKKLKSYLKHGDAIDLSFHNSSKYSFGYQVSLVSEGFGVYWDNGKMPEKISTAIYLDDGNIIVPPGGWYRNRFVIHHTVNPNSTAKLKIYVKNELYDIYTYKYNAEHKAYVYQGS